MTSFASFFSKPAMVAAGMLLAASQCAHAMDEAPGPDMNHGAPHHGHHMPMGWHGGPMGMRGMGSPVPPFLHGIELTEAQQDKVFEIMHNLAPQMREKAKAAHKARKELHELATSQNYDESKAKSLTDTLARTQADMMLMHIRTDRQILALLTAEQRKQIDERKSRHMAGRHAADGRPAHQ
jgi:Spy/CpxP family protein refolding chaperone